LPSEGTYFQLASFENISELNDKDFTKWLTREKGVAAIPISVFYPNQKDEKIVRFCFAKESETLKRAAEWLNKI
jgi:methionine aminotransferase